ncbi:hypothetical protein B0F89_10925 [Malaciobacter marinus]|jgi:hypothetical protein|uniref:Alpha/beta hydrolase n=1 Tax=Malaciobacter marinus TaxID=505249 RepID=A0AB36ZZ76_9BACT|nr:pimelyl-ACP methyl ester esterase BioV [Malaciobacter marinus]PPK61506.1 hypothetical protein B0F89_10925 [Malaciobacter marinus]
MTSNYYHGFCLSGEKELFNQYLVENDFTINGFSYGAIKAFKQALKSEKRVDLLQLFSPAFFQINDKKYKRMQLMFFKKDAKAYCLNFLENISYPKSIDTSKYFNLGTYEQLEELLTYEWKEKELKELIKKGTKIEVYLGAKDKIIKSYEAKEFFKEFATVYFINDAGHIL